MKTSTLKKAFQIIMMSSLIITATLITKNAIHTIKHLYEMEKSTSLLSIFF